MPRSRRALLKTTAITFGSGTLASLSGCVSDRPAISDSRPDDPAGRTQPNGSAAMDLTHWLPDPTETRLRDGYGVRLFDVDGIRARRDAIHENAYDRLESEMLRPVPRDLVQIADVEAAVGIDHVARVAIGSFDPEAIVERFTGNGRSSETASARTPTTPTHTPWPEPEQYEGFDLYGSEYVYAISETAVMEVAPMREGDALGRAKAIVDAQARKQSDYRAGNDYVDALFEIVDDPHAIWCYPEAMDGSTERGFRNDVITGGLKSWRFGAGTTHLTFGNTYPDPEAAGQSDLAEYVKSDRFGPYDGLDVQTDGRLVWVDGDIPTDEFDHLSHGGPSDSVHTPN